MTQEKHPTNHAPKIFEFTVKQKRIFCIMIILNLASDPSPVLI